jgi:K+/H+ antiporter YhaU regulatory subunit KhtT
LGIRQKTGCSVVAVERGEALEMEFGPEFSFEAEDVVYVCGSSDATRSFLEMFPQS